MTANLVKKWVVKSYSELYQIYKDGDLGTDRFPDGLLREDVKPSDNKATFSAIKELLEKDPDNIWYVYKTKNKKGITKWHCCLIGFTIVQRFTEPVSATLIQFGDDGIWIENVMPEEGKEAWEDGTTNTDTEVTGY